MKDITYDLISTAREKGICAVGFRKMNESADVDALIGYYTAQPDWCLERNFPDLETLREHFADCGDKGVFVDRTFHGELLNDLQAYVFHNCKGTVKVGLNVDKCIIPMIYLANGCKLRIIGVGDIVPRKPSEVPVYVFGKNEYSAKDNRYVKFLIYKHDLV